MAKKRKKMSWRQKRVGKHCTHGFRKRSAKCLKHPRKRKGGRRRSSVRRQEAAMWKSYRR